MTKNRREQLEEKQRQIAAQLRQIDAKEKAEKRKLENKEAILIGKCVLKRIELGLMTRQELHHWMNDFLVRENERAIFDLPPRSHQHQNDEAAAKNARNTKTAKAESEQTSTAKIAAELLPVELIDNTQFLSTHWEQETLPANENADAEQQIRHNNEPDGDAREIG